MKLKIKYSNTQKFMLTLNGDTLGQLKTDIRAFVNNAYDHAVREPLIVSLNGKDPIDESDDAQLKSIGIVSGDLLTVISPPSLEIGSLSQSVAVGNKQSGSVNTKYSIPKQQESASSTGATSMQTNTENINKVPCSTSIENMEDSNMSTNKSKMPINENNRTSPVKSPKDTLPITLMEATDGQPPPQSVVTMFEECCPTSAHQVVNILAHLTMLECSFNLASEITDGLPKGLKEMVSTFKYKHDGFNNFTCTVVLVSMGNVKQILVSFPGQDTEISVRVEVDDYVKSHQLGNTITTDNVHRISHLARKLRNYLLYPLQVAAHQTLDLPAPWHLAGLPHELVLKITYLLNVKDVISLGQTCHRLKSSVNDKKVWETLYKRDFLHYYNAISNVNGIDWKAKYREAYNRHKEWVKQRDEGLEYDNPYAGIPVPNYPCPDFGFPFRPDPNYPPQPHPNYPPQPHPNYPPQPHPQINPFYDPDSPHFVGEIPPVPGILPDINDPMGGLGPFGPTGPLGPLGRRPGHPGRPNNPLQPQVPPFFRKPRGPRFDFF